jgi:hypothetical protein
MKTILVLAFLYKILISPSRPPRRGGTGKGELKVSVYNKIQEINAGLVFPLGGIKGGFTVS